jgi:hypothetical protein
VDHNDPGVVVHCQDGTNYQGDIIVGADGIHSAVRTLMQQHIEITSPSATMNDKNSISVEYNCIFGLGDSVEGVVHPGDSHRSLDLRVTPSMTATDIPGTRHSWRSIFTNASNVSSSGVRASL